MQFCLSELTVTFIIIENFEGILSHTTRIYQNRSVIYYTMQFSEEPFKREISENDADDYLGAIDEYKKRFENNFAIDEDECLIDKEIICLNKKKTGGLLIFCFSCGFIAKFKEIIRSESLSLIKSCLLELKRKKNFKYCIYDNGCHLGALVKADNLEELFDTSF